MAFRDPVYPDFLAAHRQRVRRCRGMACFKEALIATKAGSGNQLERLLLGSRKIDSFGKEMWSGVCRRWANGSALPSDQTIDRISEITSSRAKVRYWRDHPLWRLMEEPAPRDPEFYCRILAGTEKQVREVLFLAWRPSRNRVPVLAEIGNNELRALCALCSLDALIALLAVARIAELSCNDERHAVACASAFSILPRVIRAHEQLMPLRNEIFFALHFCFWSWWYLDGVRQEIDQRIFEEHLAELDARGEIANPIYIGTLGHGSRDMIERMVDQTCAVLGIS